MSNTMVIVDLDIDGKIVDGFYGDFTPVSTGVWEFPWNPDDIRADTDFWKDSEGGSVTDSRTDAISPGEIKAGFVTGWYDTPISEVRTSGGVVNGSSTFFYDKSNARVLFSYTGSSFDGNLRVPTRVRFVDYAQKDPNNNLMNTGVKIDGELCGVRVVPGTVSYNQTKDDIGTARLTFDDCSFELYNTDGAFDGYADMMVGRKVSVYYAGKQDGELIGSLKDFEYVFTGVTESVEVNGSRVAINCKDPRSDWNPLVHGKETAGEDIELIANVDDKPYWPLVLGKPSKTPLNRLERTTNSSYALYAPCDGDYFTTASTDMVVKEQLSNGYVLTLTYGSGNDYTYDSIYDAWILYKDTDNDLWVEGTTTILSPITGLQAYTAVDLIAWAMEEFYGLPYNDTNYDTESFEDFAYNIYVGFYIGFEGMPLLEFLEHMLLTSGNRLFLKPSTDADGWPIMRIAIQAIRFSSSGIPYPWDIPQLDWREAHVLPGSWEYKDDEYATSERLGNAYNFIDDKPGRYSGFGFTVHTAGTPVLEPRRIENTYYTERGSALSYSFIMDFYRYRYPYFLEVQFDTPQTPTLYDQVYYQHRRNDGTKILNNSLWRVEEVDKINHRYRLALLDIGDDPTPGETEFDGTMFGSGRMYLDDITGDITEVTP